jgi:hypothetical protein
MITESIKKHLIAMAMDKYGPDIFPCDPRREGKTFDDGFTIDDDNIWFWFNGPDDSTHIVTIKNDKINEQLQTTKELTNEMVRN